MPHPLLRRLPFALLLALLLPLVGPAPAGADREAPPAGSPAGEPADAPTATPAEVFPLKDIRPGMRGYGYTIKAGTRRERFEIEVLDVIRNYLCKEDVILVRCL
ncbi:MAG: hypothetical protein ACC662_10800, partial [Planctomycetota bacterium]